MINWLTCKERWWIDWPSRNERLWNDWPARMKDDELIDLKGIKKWLID